MKRKRFIPGYARDDHDQRKARLVRSRPHAAGTLERMDERPADRPSRDDEGRAEGSDPPTLTPALAAWENEGGAIVPPAGESTLLGSRGG